MTQPLLYGNNTPKIHFRTPRHTEMNGNDTPNIHFRSFGGQNDEISVRKHKFTFSNSLSILYGNYFLGKNKLKEDHEMT